jgi:hypothetical protein
MSLAVTHDFVGTDGIAEWNRAVIPVDLGGDAVAAVLAVVVV